MRCNFISLLKAVFSLKDFGILLWTSMPNRCFSSSSLKNIEKHLKVKKNRFGSILNTVMMTFILYLRKSSSFSCVNLFHTRALLINCSRLNILVHGTFDIAFSKRAFLSMYIAHYRLYYSLNRAPSLSSLILLKKILTFILF